jgi:hypothetical protein
VRVCVRMDGELLPGNELRARQRRGHERELKGL